MEDIETCCAKINRVAQANWMTAYLSNVGFKETVIKVCPENRQNTPLLVLRHQRGLYLLRHKSEALTAQFKGRKVSLEWVIGFIKANHDEKNQETCRSNASFGGGISEVDDWRDWKK